MVLGKLIGWGCLIFGGLIIIVFPGVSQHQPDPMTKAGIIFGIFLVGLGLLLIKL